MIGDRRYRPNVPEEITEALAAEGLWLLGVASADPEPGSSAAAARTTAREEYERWLAQGYHGGMRYLERHAAGKYDPRSLLPGCRSVIVAGLNYFQHRDTGSRETGSLEVKQVGERQTGGEQTGGEQTDGKQTGGGRAVVGRVARYAWGRDYHKTLGGKLTRARTRLQGRYPEHRFRCFTDATPLAERLLAEEAGIGFIGRNTLAINARLGSWFFIGEILTTVPFLVTGAPAGTHGACPQGCRSCIAVCPTGALEAPHRIDASRCISYLTIEHKGSIPLELRPLIGEWLFGCDLCQEVCPLNAPAEPTSEPDFTIWRAGPVQELEGVLRIETDAEFTARFAGTPLMRAKRRGLLRNACVVAGNRRAQSLLPILRRRAEDADAVIAEHAAWAIEQLS